MVDELKRQYNYIVTANMIFLFLIISFMVYYNPFGYFTLSDGPTTLSGHINSLKVISAVFLTATLTNYIFLRKLHGAKKRRR